MEVNQKYPITRHNVYISPVRLVVITIVVLLLAGCPAPPGPDSEYVDPISDVQFNFLDRQDNIFFAATVAENYAGSILDTAGVWWYGTAGLSTPADTLYFNDDGLSGDILADDAIYSIKINNDTTRLNNWLTAGDTGLVYLTYFARFGDSTATLVDSFYLANMIPVILSASLDTSGASAAAYAASADTDYVITRPNNAGYEFIKVYAEVIDPDGLSDVSWVGFTSLHVGPDTLLSHGNFIYLYDDGGQVVLYPPDLTSQDETASDGIYTFAIPVYGVENTFANTKTGLFRWSFQAGDVTGERSEVYTLQVQVR